jgi:autotransporter-associated beta strand protein
MHATTTCARNSTTTMAARLARTAVVSLLGLLVATGMALVGAGPAAAATARHWTGAGADGNWSNPANWGGVAPVAGDDLWFGAGARKTNVNDFPADTTFGSLNFAAGGYDLGGNRLRLTKGVLDYNNSADTIAETVSLPILVDAAPTFSASDYPHTITYKGGFELAKNATFSGSGTNVVTGPLSSTGAVVGSAGRLVLAGTSATTGPTSVTRGALVVTGTYGGRPVTVAGGSLEGSGTVGPVTATDGAVAPQIATAKPATLTVNGALSMAAASSYNVVVNGPAAGQYSQLAVSGKVTLTNTSLVIDSAAHTSILTDGQVLTIVKNTGTAAVTGTFANAPEGAVVTDAVRTEVTFKISYKGGASGRDITLTILNGANSFAWSGLGADNKWTTGANWFGGNAPKPGDRLIFPSPAFPGDVRTTVNDFPTDTPFNRISVTGGPYVFTGNRVRLVAGVSSAEAPGSDAIAEFKIPIVAGPSAVFVGQGGNLGSLTYSGGLVLTGDVTFDQGQQTVSGPLTGPGAIFVTGFAQMRMTGSSATTGATNLQRGVLVIDGDYRSRPISVTGFSFLGGCGTAGPITADSGYALHSTGFGRCPLTVNGDLSMSGTAAFAPEFKSGTYDQAVVNGKISLAGNLSPGSYMVPSGTVWTIIKNNGPGPVVGTFANLPEGARVTGSTQFFVISYKGGASGRDVTLRVL